MTPSVPPITSLILAVVSFGIYVTLISGLWLGFPRNSLAVVMILGGVGFDLISNCSTLSPNLTVMK